MGSYWFVVSDAYILQLHLKWKFVQFRTSYYFVNSWLICSFDLSFHYRQINNSENFRVVTSSEVVSFSFEAQNFFSLNYVAFIASYFFFYSSCLFALEDVVSSSLIQTIFFKFHTTWCLSHVLEMLLYMYIVIILKNSLHVIHALHQS